MSKSSKTRGAKKRVKMQTLTKAESKLSRREMSKVKGGLLPYVEQDNLRGSSNITDGTSNTIVKK